MVVANPAPADGPARVAPGQEGGTSHPGAPRAQPAGPAGRLKFARRDGFQNEVRRRVEEHLRSTGRRQRDCPQMYLKTAVIFACLAASYALLVFAAASWWQAAPLAVALGLALAGVGFNAQHDGGHHAASDRPAVNRLMALAMDLIGASSYVWHWKHNVLHHTYVNITGLDSDIDLAPLARMTPHQRRLPFHRLQHWYLWPLYGFAALKWQFFDDFRDVLRGRVGAQRFPRPRGWGLVAFVAGKAAFFTLALGVPLLLHPWWAVLLFFGVTSFVLGVVMSVVFQLAHCVEQAAFPMPEAGGRVENSWAVHQVETTVDFAPRSRVCAWLLGGLNFQIEHHLFPRVCHVNYPAIAQVVEETCREFGVRYAVHETFRAGLASHYRWLKRMGAPEGRDSTLASCPPASSGT